jgi:hypothetical protein
MGFRDPESKLYATGSSHYLGLLQSGKSFPVTFLALHMALPHPRGHH